METENTLEKTWQKEPNSSNVRVLLVDENVSSMSCLAAYLRNLGCLCSFARSIPEACALLIKEKFNLVLSKFVLPGGGSHELVAQLAGGDASLFYSFALEDSCLWIPRVCDGKECWGAPALRPREFANVLKDLVRRALGKGQRPAGGAEAEPARISAGRPALLPLRASSYRANRSAADIAPAASAGPSKLDGESSKLVRAARR